MQLLKPVSSLINQLPYWGRCDLCIRVYMIINPRHMRSRVTIIVLSVCLSNTTKSAAYLVCTSNTMGCRILYDVFKDFVMWLSLKTLYSRVLSSIIDFLVTAAFLAPWHGTAVLYVQVWHSWYCFMLCNYVQCAFLWLLCWCACEQLAVIILEMQ